MSLLIILMFSIIFISENWPNNVKNVLTLHCVTVYYEEIFKEY